ncbi:MAG: hypothetical protein N2053_12660 [Chitinispirillaceae bacterium]|nr:hypothetical protein [Chitinispirillaceae bacterium]
MDNKKYTRTVEVGFTKINDDVIVPTWRVLTKEEESFWDNKIAWGVLGIIWLFGVVPIIKNNITPIFLSIGVLTIITFLFGLMWYLLGKIPQKWIEFNRRDGYVYVWTSRKKRKLIGKWHIDIVEIKMNYRWVSSSPRYGEYHYLIELFDNDPNMKETPFWKFDNHPKKKGVPFFVLFDLFTDPHSNDEPEDRALAWAITHQVEKFIRDFMSGKPIPLSSSNSYTFSISE